MDNLTHTLFASALAQTPLRRAGRGTTPALILASNAPDVDIVSALFGGSLDYLAAHRGVTHGLAGVAGLALVTAAVVWLLDADRWRRGDRSGASFRSLFRVALLGVGLHVLMDLPTAYGTRVLSPFSQAWYGVDWMPIIDVYLLAVLAAGLLAAAVRPSVRQRAAAIALALMVANYGLRASTHAVAMRRAMRERPNALVTAALPTFFSPLRWRIVRQFPGAYELGELDLGGGSRVLRSFDDQDNVWIRRASTTRTARVFLDFARYPAGRVIEHGPDGVVVRWDDVRFAGGIWGDRRGAGLFVVVVRLDRGGRVLDEHLGVQETSNHEDPEEGARRSRG